MVPLVHLPVTDPALLRALLQPGMGVMLEALSRAGQGLDRQEGGSSLPAPLCMAGVMLGICLSHLLSWGGVALKWVNAEDAAPSWRSSQPFVQFSSKSEAHLLGATPSIQTHQLPEQKL